MRFKSVITWSMGALLFTGLAYGAWFVYQFDRRLKAEYATASVIELITEFVTTHGGNWPTSWSDLDAIRISNVKSDSNYYRRYVVVDFTVTSEQLLSEPALIETLVVPVTGDYRTFPHARQYLARLMQTVRESNSAE